MTTGWWWLSFADPTDKGGVGFLGGCIVDGDTVRQAIQHAWDEDCNPGGQCLAFEIDPQTEAFRRFPKYRLLSREQMEAYGGDVKDAADIEGLRVLDGDAHA